MAMRLLVEGLDWAVNEARLSEIFAAFGELTETRVALDWETGRSRGFGWVTFRESTDAEAAMTGLDGQKLAGKTLRVMIAPEEAPRPNFRSADYGYTNAPVGRSSFRNADFDEPNVRPPRTDRKLYRSADFGYVDTPEVEARGEPTSQPAEGAPSSSPRKPDSAPAPRRPKTVKPPVLDDEEAANRAKYGGWEEGDGSGGDPFG